jgi:hypothetical protein
MYCCRLLLFHQMLWTIVQGIKGYKNNFLKPPMILALAGPLSRRVDLVRLAELPRVAVLFLFYHSIPQISYYSVRDDLRIPFWNIVWTWVWHIVFPDCLSFLHPSFFDTSTLYCVFWFLFDYFLLLSYDLLDVRSITYRYVASKL